MQREDSDTAAGATSGGAGTAVPEAPAARRSIFDLRAVAPLSREERAARAAAMERSLAFGAEPVRDERGWALEVDFIKANGEAVEPWKHDRRDKRLYRRNQKVTKAAGQLIGQPGDKIEWAKRLAVLHHREGSDIEGAVRRGLFDAIWRYDHVYDGYTVPRRYGTHFMKTGRVAAVAEEQRRKWITEGRAPADAFWVRNRRNTGLVLVSPNPDPDAPVPDAEEIMSGAGTQSVIGQADPGEVQESAVPAAELSEPGLPAAGGDNSGAPGSESLEAVDDEPAEVEEELFGLDPADELALLEQLGVDLSIPRLPGDRVTVLREQLAKASDQETDPGSFQQIVDGFEDAWDDLQRKGLRFYIPPGRLRETYDALPRGRALVDLIRSIAPGSGEAQSLLDFGEATSRFFDRLLGADVQGARQAAIDAATYLAGAIPAAGAPVRGARTLGKTSTARGGIKKAKTIPSRRPLQVVLEETPGRNEQGRLRQIRDQVKRTLPAGFLDQTAAQAIAKTRFPPRDPRENVRRGLAAADLVIEQALRGEPGVLANAMFRKDVGPIAFLFGKPGNPAKKYKKGGGLSHIIAKHGVEYVDDVVETIAKGSVTRRSGVGTGERMVVVHRGHEAVLSLFQNGERQTWLLTGYKIGLTDKNFDLSQLREPIFFKPN